MAVQMVFPNYAVADIAPATAFSEALGFAKNPVFSDDWLENLLAMLLGSPEEVDAFASAGTGGGGTLSKPVEANEWGMYGGQLTDPDGHIIDFFSMEAPPA